MPEFRKFLDLSTGHLKKETLERLEKITDPNELPFSGGITSYGWVAYAHDDFSGLTDCPEEMFPIMTKARELGCDYILFDCDASTEPDLFPVFDHE